jgi:hypothetical protein
MNVRFDGMHGEFDPIACLFGVGRGQDQFRRDVLYQAVMGGGKISI